MRLAFSTNAFTRQPLDEVLPRIRDIGYAGAELMGDRPHLWPPDVTDEMIEGVRECARSADLAFANLNGFMMKAVGDIHHPSWIEPDPSDRKTRLTHTRACLELCRRLGVPSVSTEPGGPLEGRDRGEAERWFAEGIAAAAETARDSGVRLLVEPEPDLLFEGMDETVRFLDAMGNPEGVGINMDLGHFFCIGLDPAQVIAAHPDRLEHVHIEDIGADRVHRHLIPGQGAMDFAAIFKALHEARYDGFVTVELYPFEETPVEAARAAFEHLSPYLAG